MQKVAPRISVVGWCLWLAVNLAFNIYHRESATAGFSLMSVLQSCVQVSVFGSGAIATSAILCRLPHRVLALILAGISLFVLWKFYIGIIFFKMHPQLGGLTFGESVADYWQHVSRNVFLLVGTVPLGIFVAVSIIFWPLYGLFYGSEKDHNAV